MDETTKRLVKQRRSSNYQHRRGGERRGGGGGALEVTLPRSDPTLCLPRSCWATVWGEGYGHASDLPPEARLGEVSCPEGLRRPQLTTVQRGWALAVGPFGFWNCSSFFASSIIQRQADMMLKRQSEGCRFDPTLSVSKCPWARRLTPNCSWRAGWYLAWQPIAVGVWMCEWEALIVIG